jgi:hypothetical protein
MLQAAIRNEYDKFDCVNVRGLLAKLRRDFPRILFTPKDVENMLMEDGFYMDRRNEWKIRRDK